MEISNKYAKIKLLSIVKDAPLPFDIYLYLRSNDKMVLFRKKNQILEKEKIEAFLSKNISEVYISKTDEKQVLRHTAKSIISVINDESKNEDTKKEIIKAASNELLEDLFSETSTDNPQEILDKCHNVVNAIVTLISDIDFSSDYAELFDILSDEKINKAHLQNVSTLSTLFCMGLGHIHHQAVTSISTGALLHDVGLEFLDDQVVEKYRSGKKLSSKDMKEIQKHVYYGLGILKKKMPTLSDEAVMIIRQHHEKPDGSGYPDQLVEKKIYHLAKIVSIANDFDKLINPLDGSTPRAPQQAMQFMYFEKGSSWYDTGLLAKIMFGLNIKIDKNYQPTKYVIED